MFVHGDSSGYDLIKWMQPRGDLQTIWIMFDHVKHVESWRPFACHVYDSFLLQSDDDCDMWYAIWRHGSSMCNVTKFQQGHGK